MAAAPLGIDLAPLTELEVNVKLKPEAKDLQIGDVLAASISYMHPFSKDFYVLTHVFKVNEQSLKGGEVKEPKQPQMNKPKQKEGK
jgi:hypothetical protein